MNWETEGKLIEPGAGFIEKEQAVIKCHKILIWGTSNSIHKLNKRTVYKKMEKKYIEVRLLNNPSALSITS